MNLKTETAVVIVTYNSFDDIEDCVNSVRGASGAEIIVVDNSSTDRTPIVLRRLRDEGLIDQLVLSATNDGFAKAVNRGVQLAGDADVFLLNPDATIEAIDLEKLRSIVRTNRNIGIIAPLVDNGPQVHTLGAGRQPTLWPLFTHFSGLARLFPRVHFLRGRHLYKQHHSSVEQDVEWVSGCAMYITREALDTVGLLSERWFMYGEDIEFAHRVSRAGFRVKVTPEARAWHAIGASVNQASGPVSTMWAENTYSYYVSEFSPGLLRRLLWRLIFSGGLGVRGVLLSVRARRVSGKERVERLARARRFFAFARSVWTIKPT